jgi:hypothetical protein
MSHLSVRTLLEDVAKSLADNIHFDAGRESEFNNLKEKEREYLWLLPIAATPRFAVNDTHNYMKVWSCSLLFMEQDKFDANNNQSNEILDRQDILVDKFMNRLNDWSQTQQDTTGDISIRSVRQLPFFKEQAGVMTGWKLDFQLEVPDSFEYCTDDNQRIYAGTY